MYRGKKISVYFPCRNEANHLKEIIGKVPSFVDEVIIVSNKSADNTLEVARALSVTALEDNRTIGNIGYGFAHMTGMAAATGDIIATADGDGTYPIEQLSKVIDHLLDNKLDFISCNRYPVQPGTVIPFKLRLGVGILNWETRVLFGMPVKDILSGMWVMRKEVPAKLNLTMGEWNMSPEVKIKAYKTPGVRFGEFSIAQYDRLGATKQNHWKTGFAHLWWILKHRLGLA